MPPLKQLSRVANHAASRTANKINWFPGHMFVGMKAMMGKLNTVDCVIEVHDARIPFHGRNTEFRQHLGLVKPHILVLNKSDLADLSQWDQIESRLQTGGTRNVFLTDLTGTSFSFQNRGYTKLMDKVVHLVNQSDGFNRQSCRELRVMIVGIPNVGKSTLINRLRQHHIGLKGEPAKVGSTAGVTRHVDNKIQICARPAIYSIDTPGVLEPSATKNLRDQMPLALCSTISDRVLNSEVLASYLLKFFNKRNNFMYQEVYQLKEPIDKPQQLVESPIFNEIAVERIRDLRTNHVKPVANIEQICWRFIKDFRLGRFGKVIFD